MAEQKDVKGTYSMAKQQAGWKFMGPPTSLLVDGKIISSHKELAEAQKRTFQNKVKKLIANLPPPTRDPLSTLKTSLEKWDVQARTRPKLEFVKITELETLKLIQKLGNNTSQADDKMDALAIKNAAAILHGPITHIINQTISTSIFPQKWKIGKLLPLFKGKGSSTTDPEAYGPISLLPIIGKLTERAIQGQIMNFMRQTNQLN